MERLPNACTPKLTAQLASYPLLIPLKSPRPSALHGTYRALDRPGTGQTGLSGVRRMDTPICPDGPCHSFSAELAFG